MQDVPPDRSLRDGERERRMPPDRPTAKQLELGVDTAATPLPTNANSTKPAAADDRDSHPDMRSGASSRRCNRTWVGAKARPLGDPAREVDIIAPERGVEGSAIMCATPARSLWRM